MGGWVEEVVSLKGHVAVLLFQSFVEFFSSSFWGTKRVLENGRLAMGFANVRASRYGIR